MAPLVDGGDRVAGGRQVGRHSVPDPGIGGQAVDQQDRHSGGVGVEQADGHLDASGHCDPPLIGGQPRRSGPARSILIRMTHRCSVTMARR